MDALLDQFLEESSLIDEIESYYPEGQGSVMYNHLALNQSNPHWEIPSPPGIDEEELFQGAGVAQDEDRMAERKRQFDEEPKVRRYPAILQTNHQINSQASALLDSNLAIEVGPGGVMFSDTWDCIVSLGDSVWHSCPAQLGIRISIERLEFGESDPGGTVDPQTFAKFDRISYNADLKFVDEDEARLWPTILVDDNYHTSREDEATFTLLLSGAGSNGPLISNVLQHLVDALLPFPNVSQLDASLSVKVEPAFDIDDDEADGEEGNDEGAEGQDEKEERKMSVANERATELVLEVGVLIPLERLEKVGCLGSHSFLLQCEGSPFRRKSGLGKMVRELKGVVEGKFVARHGPTWTVRSKKMGLIAGLMAYDSSWRRATSFWISL